MTRSPNRFLRLAAFLLLTMVPTACGAVNPSAGPTAPAPSATVLQAADMQALQTATAARSRSA